MFITNVYANTYLEHALNNNIHKSKNWKNILHIADKKSEILDDSFFLSSEKTAKSELISALQQLHNKDTVCLYPARYTLLKNELNITNDILDISKCEDVNRFIKELNVSSVSLVFTSAFFGSPAAMFGHSFLHLNDISKNRMLGHSISFAASVPKDENTLSYVYNGLSGGYKAEYSIEPYYKKINEYSDLEQRDMWEYELELTILEKQQLLYHIYELQDIKKQYSYAKYNCAYNLLWILEVSKKSSIEKDMFTFLPAETIQIINDKHWIKNSSLIPSLQNKIQQNYKLLEDENLIADITAIAYSKLSIENFNNQNMSLSDKQLVLSTSVLYMQYLVTTGQLENKDYQVNFLKILKLRSKLGSYTKKKEFSFVSNPLIAHKTQNLALSLGTKDSAFLSEASYRAGYQSLDDPSNGFFYGSEVVYFDFQIEASEKKVQLNNFTLFELSSLTPRNQLFKPISWQAGLSLDREYLNDTLQGHFFLGAGLTYDIGFGYSYFLLNAHTFYNLKSNTAISGKYGLLLNKYKHSINFYIEQFYYFTGENQLVYKLHDYYFINKNFGLTAKIESIEKENSIENRFTVGISNFF